MTIDLRADIRRLGSQLGDTLTRQHGRRAARTRRGGPIPHEGDAAPTATRGPQLASRPCWQISTWRQVVNLVRAFSAYFHLANVAEQTHRVGDLAPRGSRPHVRCHGRPDRGSAGPDPEVLDDVLDRLELRPVFTAHPTEAVRRTLLTKLGRIADLLDRSEQSPRSRQPSGPESTAASPRSSTRSGRPTS